MKSFFDGKTSRSFVTRIKVAHLKKEDADNRCFGGSTASVYVPRLIVADNEGGGVKWRRGSKEGVLRRRRQKRSVEDSGVKKGVMMNAKS